MSKSKEMLPERNGKKWSHCYGDPVACQLHFHGDLKNLTQKQDAVVLNVTEGESADSDPMNIFKTVESTHVSVIASVEAFDEAVAGNLVFRSNHPEYPYSIYKYSQFCTYSGEWNEVTTASRGLILHSETGEIIARPFQKFFNYSEGKTPSELMVGDVHVTEKLDGSLGIGFVNPDGELEISTAGGFQSEQAAHASEVYNERYKGEWEPREGVTYMWEIIYPENRIVVDYGDEDDLYLLGAVDIASGKSYTVDELPEWKWKKAKTYDGFESMEAVVNAPERSNAEGYIVHFKDTGAKVKFKHEEYVRVHRIATGLSEYTLHDLLANGGQDKIEEYRKYAPEEFLEFIDVSVAKLEKQYSDEESRIKKAYESFVKSLPADVDQKSFALAVHKDVPKDLASHMFTLHSGKGIASKKIWDSIKPAFTKSFWSANNGKTIDK